ncbi:hypothetical protein D9615_009398 [Tricholomella constricta]|uniref:Uncharacterized protein n=1 Tax=Tricholomella constricta TaxID=117010 RepID=A0A8H5H2S9_9AGAR|nr:hypothetical protein D9615_009398 [Tricholomella constricta]
MLPALVVSEAVGYATTSDTKYTFDDLKDVGLWPAHQYIKKPNGIEITYQLSNTTQPSVQMHGMRSGTQKTVTVAGEFLTMSSSLASSAPLTITPISPTTLRRIGFLVYNKDTGPFPDPTVSTQNIVGFTSLGLIVGFSGTSASNGNLDTVAVYKVQSGGATNIGVSDALTRTSLTSCFFSGLFSPVVPSS